MKFLTYLVKLRKGGPEPNVLVPEAQVPKSVAQGQTKDL